MKSPDMIVSIPLAEMVDLFYKVQGSLRWRLLLFFTIYFYR